MSTYFVPSAANQPAVQLRELTTGGELVSAGNGLPVNIVAGSSAGTQYTDAGTPPANPVGTAIIFDLSGAWADVGVDHPLPTVQTGALPAGTNVIGTVNTLHGSAVSANAQNSTTTTLTSGSVFTGAWESSLNYSAISVEAFADQASAAGGLQIQQSQDATNADTSDNFTVSASTNFQQTVNLTGQYFRVKYTNGGTNQGAFRLQTIKQTSEAALPRTLSAAGNLKTAIQEPALGSAVSASSLPVVIASDQAAVATKAAAAAFADGAITTLGLEADAAVTNPASSATLIALVKGLLTGIVLNTSVNSIGKVSIQASGSPLNSDSACLDVCFSHNNATVPANTASNTVIKASAGVLATVTVTATGTAGINLYDNASTNSGTILLAIPANAPVGTIYQLSGKAANGITAGGVTNCPALTIYYA